MGQELVPFGAVLMAIGIARKSPSESSETDMELGASITKVLGDDPAV